MKAYEREMEGPPPPIDNDDDDEREGNGIDGCFCSRIQKVHFKGDGW